MSLTANSAAKLKDIPTAAGYDGKNFSIAAEPMTIKLKDEVETKISQRV
jgi:hypothetical protein